MNRMLKSDVARNVFMTLICIILGIIIAWQFQGISKNRLVLSDRNKRNEEVLAELLNERSNNEKLRQRIDELQSDLSTYKLAQGDYDEVTRQLTREIQEARMVAGLTAVKGKGIIMKIDGIFSTSIETDLLKIINEMRASDIQAISINEQRLVATSEIKAISSGPISGYLVVNGIQIMLPLEIKAIADPVNLENALTMTGGLIDALRLYYSRIEIKKAEEVIIPAVRDDGTIIRTNLLTPVSGT